MPIPAPPGPRRGAAASRCARRLVDPRAVSLAAGPRLAGLAADAPLVVAIDDLQWIDGPSARVLSFVLRRLADERIGVLASIRHGPGSTGDPVELDRAVDPNDASRRRPIAARAARSDPSRSTEPADCRTPTSPDSIGSPAATRCSRSRWPGRRPATASAPIPTSVWAVPEDLQQLLSARLAALPSAAHEPLLAIAATSQPTWDLVLEIDGIERADARLARPGRECGRHRAGEWSGPVLASPAGVHRLRECAAGRTACTPRPPRHADDRPRGTRPAPRPCRGRARPGGRGGPRPGGPARPGARRPGRRGGPRRSRLSDDAARSSVDELRRRRLDAAEYRFDAGDATRATGCSVRRSPSTAPGPERAKILYRLASMSWMNLINGVRAPCEQAPRRGGRRSRASDRDPSGLWPGSRSTSAISTRRWRKLERPSTGSRARRRTSRAPMPSRRSRSSSLSGAMRVRPRSPRPSPSRRIAISKGSWTEGSVYTPPGLMLGLELMWMGRLDEARDILEAELARVRAARDVHRAAGGSLLPGGARMPRRSVRARRALRGRELGHRPGVRTGATQSQVVLFNQAWPRALLGRIDEAREQATTGVRLAEANDDRFNAAWNHAVLGFIDLSLGRSRGRPRESRTAVAWLDCCTQPSPRSSRACRISSRRSWHSAGSTTRSGTSTVSRSRPARDAAAGRRRRPSVAGRSSPPPPAISTPPSVPPRGRSSSLEGDRSRSRPRGRCWSSARSIGGRRGSGSRGRLLERARDAFAELGAPLWVDRAEAELARIGGRPSTPFELTETETRSRRSSPAARRTRKTPTRCSSARARSRPASSASTRSSASGRGRSSRRASVAARTCHDPGRHRRSSGGTRSSTRSRRSSSGRSPGPGALVLEGSAGIGKTTLWSAGVQVAQQRGYRVLTTRAAESEARLSYAALGDLLGSVSADAFAGMPPPLRQAIDAALLRTDVQGVAPDQRAVSLATAHALRNLSWDAPLVLAVDDVQWLDRPSARVLSFALRRLAAEAIGALVSLRIAPDSPGDLLELDRASARDDAPRGRAARTGAARADPPRSDRPPCPRPVARGSTGSRAGTRCSRSRWLEPRSRDRAPSPSKATCGRCRTTSRSCCRRAWRPAVPQAARAPLLAIAATSQPTWDLVLEMAGSEERTLGALDRAEEAGIIERSGGRVRFTHPLLGSTLYLNTPAGERMALHARLAALAPDLEERARHLALATGGRTRRWRPRSRRRRDTPGPGARPTRRRTWPTLSCEMTTSADSVGLRRRRLAAAEYHFDGGDAGGARRVCGRRSPRRRPVASGPRCSTCSPR